MLLAISITTDAALCYINSRCENVIFGCMNEFAMHGLKRKSMVKRFDYQNIAILVEILKIKFYLSFVEEHIT